MTPEIFTTDSFEARMRNIPVGAVYGQALGRPEWGRKLDALPVSEAMKMALARWIVFGTPRGGFLRALVGNDLIACFERGDEVNTAALRDYVTFLYNYAPAGAYGSYEKVAAWIEQDGLTGEREAD